MNIGPESETVEHKRSTSELREGVSSIAAMLNKHGRGTLYFGVRNDGEVVGQQVADTTLREISQAIGHSIEPRVFPTIDVLDDGEGRSFIEVAFEGAGGPYACKGSYRIRVADEDVLMTNDEIAHLMSRAHYASNPWDRQPSSRPLSDVKEDVLRAFVGRGNEKSRISEPYAGVVPTLASLKLLADGALTNAAEVLFCESRDVQLKMGILESHARTEILDLHQEKGSLFELVDKASLYILNNTRRRFVIDGLGPRKEIPELPTGAVREALVNAYAHRDWTSRASVQVDVFYDSVEIYSPGWFIEGQSPEAHLYEGDTSSLSRNQLLCEAIYRSGDMESYGTGIGRIKRLCDEAGVRVEYVKVPSGTKLVFHRNDAFGGTAGEGVPMSSDNGASSSDNGTSSSDNGTYSPSPDLTGSEARAYAYIAANGEARSSEIAAMLGITQRGAAKILRSLADRGVLDSMGANRNRRYTLGEHGRQNLQHKTARP